VPEFHHDGLNLHFSERGDPQGPPFVMVHGLLWSSRMLRRIAGLLPDHRVLLLDVRGHIPSDRPTDPARYSWSSLAGDVVGLLDHLGIDRAVVGGLSLGANVTLATAMDHPDRVAAMVVEMPVLDRARTFGHAVFGGLARALELGGSRLGAVTAAIARLPAPRSIPEVAALRDVLSLDPVAGAALVRGLLADDLVFDRIAPEQTAIPALVIAHRGDPLHVLADARELVARLPDAQLIERWSIADYRIRPDLLAIELTKFLAEAELSTSG
jgi:pimeloyl-ACP methyl ester carboxylesterase